MAQRTFKTPEGLKISVFEEPNKKAVFHSENGPAIKYPKAMKKEDEYYLYGIKFTKEEWLAKLEDVKVTYIPIDIELG